MLKNALTRQATQAKKSKDEPICIDLPRNKLTYVYSNKAHERFHPMLYILY